MSLDRPTPGSARRWAWPASLLAGLLVCWPGIAVAEPTTPPPTITSPSVSAPTSTSPTASVSPTSPTPSPTPTDTPTMASTPASTSTTPESSPSASTRPAAGARADLDVAMVIDLQDLVSLPQQGVLFYLNVTGPGVSEGLEYGYTVTLPTTVTLVGGTPDFCTRVSSTVLHCASGQGQFFAMAVVLDADLPLGSEVSFTSTLDPVPGDTNRANDTATASTLVIGRTDLQVQWDHDEVTVAPGALARTRVTVTNRGRSPRSLGGVTVEYRPPGVDLETAVRAMDYPASCFSYTYEFFCDPPAPLLGPGQSASFEITWRFTRAALGRDYPIDASVFDHEDQESNPRNDTSRLVFHIRRAPASASASPTTSASPTDASESTTAPVLADTGGPGILPVGLALGALALGLVTRPRRSGRHG